VFKDFAVQMRLHCFRIFQPDDELPTLPTVASMSAPGQNATYRVVRDESANPPITDMIVHAANVAMGQEETSRQKARKILRLSPYFVSAAICWSNRARTRFQPAFSGESFTRRVIIACPRCSAASASLGSLD
jgi:hypothetical protein